MFNKKSWDTDLLLALILVSLEPGGAIVVGQFAGLMVGVVAMAVLTLIVWGCVLLIRRIGWLFGGALLLAAIAPWYLYSA
jgi:hypothetical protein